MSGQTIIVALIVTCALAFIARRVWNTARTARAAKAGCGSDCGCEPGGSTKDWAE